MWKRKVGKYIHRCVYICIYIKQPENNETIDQIKTY